MVATIPTREDPYPQYKIELLDQGSPGMPARLFDADERISSGGLSFTARRWPTPSAKMEWTTFGCSLWMATPGRPITNFSSEQIVEFHWAPDGKSLGILRGHTDSDVVLIRDSER